MQQDAEGNWHTGAIAAATDDVCAAAIMSVEGIIKVSVHYDISYFAPAKLHVRSLTTISDPSDFLFPPRESACQRRSPATSPLLRRRPIIFTKCPLVSIQIRGLLIKIWFRLSN